MPEKRRVQACSRDSRYRLPIPSFPKAGISGAVPGEGLQRIVVGFTMPTHQNEHLRGSVPPLKNVTNEGWGPKAAGPGMIWKLANPWLPSVFGQGT